MCRQQSSLSASPVRVVKWPMRGRPLTSLVYDAGAPELYVPFVLLAQHGPAVERLLHQVGGLGEPAPLARKFYGLPRHPACLLLILRPEGALGEARRRLCFRLGGRSGGMGAPAGEVAEHL